MTPLEISAASNGIGSTALLAGLLLLCVVVVMVAWWMWDSEERMMWVMVALAVVTGVAALDALHSALLTRRLVAPVIEHTTQTQSQTQPQELQEPP